MNYNNIELKILVKNRPISEYLHRGQIYVEGRAGSEYEIELHNNTSGRVEAVLSVDGLSVIDGKTAGQQSPGYLIEAHQTVKVPGWTLDNNNVAKFAFSGKKESYATQMTGDARNNGVIGVMVFSEKYVRPVYNPPVYTSVLPNYVYRDWTSINHNSRSYGWGSTGLGGVTYNANSMAPQASASNTHDGSVASDWAGARSYKKGMSSDAQLSANSSLGVYAVDTDYLSVEQSLGTEFGQSTQFTTITVNFQRGDMLCLMSVMYDDLRGLRQRGIVMERTKKGQPQSQPQAFPGNVGCEPPKNWRG